MISEEKTIQPRRDRFIDILSRTHKLSLPREGEVLEGIVIRIEPSRLYVDLGLGTGIVFGKEFQGAKEIIKRLSIGDTVSAKINATENEDGYFEISLKDAGREKIWKEARELKNQRTPIFLKILEANKGGLVLEWKGMKGFLPVSQLSTDHYPRVEGGDKNKILEELQKFIGQEISETVLDVNMDDEKLIFSEKEKEPGELRKKLEAYAVGEEREGVVSGVVDFGIFVKLEEHVEGLVHISELDWSLVESPADLFSLGDPVRVKVIGIDGDKISLSIKALKPDPWKAVNYQKGDIIQGRVTKLTKFGAFIQIIDEKVGDVSGKIYGLAHVSEFGTLQAMKQKIDVGQIYPFQIAVFQPEIHKLSLLFLGDEAAKIPGSPAE